AVFWREIEMERIGRTKGASSNLEVRGQHACDLDAACPAPRFWRSVAAIALATMLDHGRPKSDGEIGAVVDTDVVEALDCCNAHTFSRLPRRATGAKTAGQRARRALEYCLDACSIAENETRFTSQCDAL